MPVRRLIHQAHRVLSLPPRVIVQKVIGRVRRHCHDRARRRGDFRHPTYLGEEPFPSQQLFRYLDGLSGAPWSFPISRLASLLENYCRHRFDLLGSGWMVVRHGIECKGMEGHRYHVGSAVDPDAEGNWLNAYINSANLKESRRIWRMIHSGYEPIDWQLDFKSGFRWSESDWYKQIPFVHTGHKPGVDIKVPWELARMQHLPLLAYGFAVASKSTQGLDTPEVYANEFRNQILDFIASNPPRFGVNWACTMDVAIRAANWLVSYDLFHAFGARFDGDFERELMRSVYQHGEHIISNLEWNNESVGNHYLADIAGLLFVAAYLPRSADTDLWLAFSVQELVKEVGRQFLPDGTNFEASTSYHRLCAEMVVYTTALVLGLNPEKYNALIAYDHTVHRAQPLLHPAPIPLYAGLGQHDSSPFPDWYIERVGLMAQFTRHTTRPDGHIVQIGDCDNGRFLKLHPSYVPNDPQLPEEQLDHSHLASAIGALLDAPTAQSGAKCEHVDSYVVRRLVKESRYGSGTSPAQPQPTTVGDVSGEVASTPGDLREGLRLAAYPNFGLFIYKSPRVYFAIRCGRGDINQIGNHAHNDNLSFELALDGNSLITDPGTYVYTPSPDMRNRFRSTAMHNTLVIDGREQNDWSEGREGLFFLRDRSNPRVIACQLTHFVGEHSGFGSPHRREVRIMQSGIQARDHCEVEGIKKVLFHVSPSLNVSVARNSTSVDLINDSHTYRLSSVDGEWSIADSYYSHGYGSLTRTPVIALQTASHSVEWAIEV